jgi:hypothetical protein
MRVPSLIVCALAFGIAAASATEPLRNGAYVSLTTPSAAACARACADDGICMAWTFRAENACELSAVVSASQPTAALASGLSQRAPAFALRQTTPPPAQIDETPAAAPQGAAAEPEEELMTAAADEDGLLLGGPEDSDLRLRLGARR